jgi:predicted nicotinamide N-methyase
MSATAPDGAKRRRVSATTTITTVQQRGLTLELDDPPSSSCEVAPEDHGKDGTGIGQIWQGATDLLCDWLEAHSQWVLQQGRSLELGAGVGLAGLLVAKLGGEATLTDHHPKVLSRLRANVALNGLEQRASVQLLDWSVPASDPPRRRLVFGADLAFAQRSAAQCAERARELLCDEGVFLYAHQERRAIFMGADGQVQREASDSGLDALLAAAAPLECRRLRERELPDQGERVVLLALGMEAALDAVPR